MRYEALMITTLTFIFAREKSNMAAKVFWMLMLTLCVHVTRGVTGASIVAYEAMDNLHDNTTATRHNDQSVRNDIRSKVTSDEDSGTTNSTIAKHNGHDFGIVLNSERLCEGNTYLLIVVCSAVGNVERRAAIRQTWGSIANSPADQTRILFYLGHEGRNDTPLQRHIQQESDIYQDIVQSGFIDDYRNLTLKSIAFLQWIDTYCAHVKFVLKTDDDSFINVPVLLKDLHNCVHTKFFMGHIIAAAPPIREKTSKYFTPEALFRGKMYPKYLSGSGYVISGDLVHDLYQATRTMPLFWLEDVYITGLCGRSIGAQQIFNPKFGLRKRGLDPCSYRKVIVGHELSPAEMVRIWSGLNSPVLDCEIQIGKTYSVVS